jgi:preprotein translocase subunit SecA
MLETILKNTPQQVLSKYRPYISEINKLENNLKLFTDLELKNKTNELKQRLVKKEKDHSITIEAFALVREASKRVLGLRHFDVQIIGGLVLNEGRIAEMKTGEGKTLVALLPTFLNALRGNGTHVVTVNDYLAKRDAECVGQVHRFLGLTVGLIQSDMTTLERRENYNCDIVYLNNTELGFDYLRDNMANSLDEIVQRPFFYCVIDEVDSILIDEARTPLIISGSGEPSTEKYLQTAKLTTFLQKNIHYNVDEKTRNVTLTNEGVSLCEQALGIVNLSSPDEPWISYILNSVKAKELFQRNKNYIIDENNEILIVDEFTGRTMPGRRWSDGLHQAIEAKENLPIQDENRTLASISYQNLFLLFKRLSGMTGTAKTEEIEFEKTYNFQVTQIPTHKPVIRKDLSDLIYKNEYTKWRFIANECLEMYNIGRPVLIGTTTIEKSELLACLLNEYKVPYQLLNAKPENVESESAIIAQAGCKNAITIATNMAGRGTDILLGGNPTFLTTNLIEKIFENKENLQSNKYIKNLNCQDLYLIEDLAQNYKELLKQPLAELKTQSTPIVILFLQLYSYIFTEQEKLVTESNKIIRKLGGLHVIGTERHESRRIDNQLRGRSGRQGDPGSSRFFLCLEDKLLRIFGGEQILNIMQNIGLEDETPIQSGLLNKSLESAQKKVEAFYFDTRKQLFEYDQAINIQRDSIYGERKRILEYKSIRKWIIDYIERSCNDLFNKSRSAEKAKITDFLKLKLQNLSGASFTIDSTIKNTEDLNLIFLQQQLEIAYDLKELEIESIETGLFRELEKLFMLNQIDSAWTDHLQKISFLRESIGWVAYGQKDPLTEYKKEAFNYFNKMLSKIRHRVIYFVLRAEIKLISFVPKDV